MSLVKSIGVFALFAGSLAAQINLFPYSAPSCGHESVSKSATGGQAVTPALTNNTSKTVRYYWLDWEGKRTGGGVMRPGESHTLNTYIGHRFVFTNQEDGTCLTLGEFRAGGTHRLEFMPNGLPRPGPAQQPSGPEYKILLDLGSTKP